MIDATRTQWAIKSGLSAVCANCLRYWEKQDLVPEARPLEHFKPAEAGCQVRDCGGPIVNRAFPKYSGPLEGKLASICFICGAEPDAAVEMAGRGYLGVCNAHIEQFKKMLGKPGAPPPQVRERLVQVV
jgi:hypothetical protein